MQTVLHPPHALQRVSHGPKIVAHNEPNHTRYAVSHMNLRNLNRSYSGVTHEVTQRLLSGYSGVAIVF